MKFIVSSSLLLKNLQSIMGVINSNNTLPILDDFLFELNDEILTITASDLETTISVTVKPDMAEEPGSVAIPAKILVDTLKTFSDIPVSFNINLSSLIVELSAGEGKYKLSGHTSDEYPRTPALEETTALRFDSAVLSQASGSSSPASTAVCPPKRLPSLLPMPTSWSGTSVPIPMPVPPTPSSFPRNP